MAVEQHEDIYLYFSAFFAFVNTIFDFSLESRSRCFDEASFSAVTPADHCGPVVLRVSVGRLGGCSRSA